MGRKLTVFRLFQLDSLCGGERIVEGASGSSTARPSAPEDEPLPAAQSQYSASPAAASAKVDGGRATRVPDPTGDGS